MSAGAPRRFTGGHMLALMIAFFGIVIGVNVAMAVLASTSWTGLIVKNGYIASIDYAHIEAAKAAARERGWTVHLEAPGGILRLNAVDADGKPLAVAHEATAEPFGHVKDVSTIRLVDGPLGVHSEEPLAPGRYILRATVGTGGQMLEWRAAVDVHP